MGETCESCGSNKTQSASKQTEGEESEWVDIFRLCTSMFVVAVREVVSVLMKLEDRRQKPTVNY